MDEAYQQKHAMFVSNHSGTEPETLFFINSIVPVSSLLLRLLITILAIQRFQTIVEIVVIIFPPVLAFTVWSSTFHIILIILVLICTLLLVTACICRRKNFNECSPCSQVNNKIKSRLLSLLYAEVLSEKITRTLLTEYRSHLLLSTVICILAVDFPIFPRHFAKTETYGWSLMDAGVGSFVIANGIVSSQARGKTYPNMFLHMRNTFKASLPIILIGIIRLVATRSVGYHEHVSEYGVHWNFFITLALTKVFCTFISALLPSISCGILSLVLISFYQHLLTSCGVSDYLLSSERKNLIQANKEGIYSLFGYTSLYFAGAELGKFLSKKRVKLKDWMKALFLILIFVYVTWILMHSVSNNIERVSRRTANLPYYLWMLSFNCYNISLHLLELILMEILKTKVSQKPVSSSQIEPNGVILWNAISENALFYFLFANLVTGIINIFVQTIHASVFASLIIILTYAITLSLCMVLLHTNFIKMKFW